jgi:hypothetical protein
MDQAARGIHSDMRFHPEVLLFAFLGLVHFRVSFFPFSLGGAGRLDDGGIHNGSFVHEDALSGQAKIQLVEHLFFVTDGLPADAGTSASLLHPAPIRASGQFG